MTEFQWVSKQQIYIQSLQKNNAKALKINKCEIKANNSESYYQYPLLPF